VLDYVNAEQVRATLSPRTVRRIGDHEVEERRAIRPGTDGDRIVKAVTIRDALGGVVEHYEEAVALYDETTMAALLESAGWRERVRFGDYRGAPWTPMSPRFLVVATSPR
jgi:hypothetical protein